MYREGNVLLFSEYDLELFSKPLSTTEENKCKNAIRMVADALKELSFTDDNKEITPMYADTLSYHLELRSLDNKRYIKIFVQGSYANNTNVRTHSDVDIAVIQEERFSVKYRSNQSNELFGFITLPPAAHSFKDEVEYCLVQKFDQCVERKNKSIKINGNTYRKDADAVPCHRYRDYRSNYDNNSNNYIPGVVIIPDRGSSIINYPEQHIANGRRKNADTNHYYKKMVRIMKKIRYLMQEDANYAYKQSANNVSSFMLESLLWNISDEWYIANCMSNDKCTAFKNLVLLLASITDFTNYREANGIKPLCENSEQSLNLMSFISNLLCFYEIA